MLSDRAADFTRGAVQNAERRAERFVVRPSGIAGLGVYTCEAVPAKQILLEYTGALPSRKTTVT